MVFSSPRLDTSHRFERWVVAPSLWNPPRSCTQRGAVGWVGTMLDGGVKTWSQLQGSAPIVPSLMFEIFRRKWPPWASATRKRGWAVRSLWVPKYNYFMKFFKFLLWSWGIQSHHFMANRRGKMETVTDFLFLGSKITADNDCSLKIKGCLFSGRKARINLAY